MLKNILVFAALSVVFSSCIVSKKKYDALLLEKNELSTLLNDKKQENKALKSDLNQAVKDFESLKSDFNKSNALRSDEIADLMVKVTQLEDKSSELNTKLKETIGKFKATEKANYQADEELKNTLIALAALKRDTASLHYSINMAKQRSSSIQNELTKTKNKLRELNTGKYELNKALDAQTLKVKSMEQKLIKSQQNLSEISNTFIELRKELLTAKSKNQAIDPNKNNYINRIAKLLGHY